MLVSFVVSGMIIVGSLLLDDTIQIHGTRFYMVLLIQRVYEDA